VIECIPAPVSSTRAKTRATNEKGELAFAFFSLQLR